MRHLEALVLAVVGSFGCVFAQAPAAPPRSSGDPLPVREVTCFKDGHAFVLRERPLKGTDEGRVELENLPAPVLGTFWPYATGGAKLVSATAGKERVLREKTALTLREMLEGNVGANVIVFDVSNEKIEGVLVSVPARSGEELERLDPRAGSPSVEAKGEIVLVRGADGLRAMPMTRVRDVVFKDRDGRTARAEELRDRLTLRIEGSGPQATVGVVYVQRGLRWIPAYKVDIDGAGKAAIELEATLVNDLIDLEDATVNLVIGVPRFEFAGMLDPIALQEALVQIERQVQQGRMSGLSNMMMTQAAQYAPSVEQGVDQAPSVEGAASNEDLFVFTLRHVTLRKGERMVLPVTKIALDYRDVYTLDVPIAPPLDFKEQYQGERVTELAKLLAAPKAMHTLRLKNDSSVPLTTAPALLFSKGRVLAQSLMTYTPIGAETDLPMTTAIDVAVISEERETGRTPKSVRWDDNDYGRIDMLGTIELSNKKSAAIDLEVRRLALGLVDGANLGGTVEQKSLLDVWGMPDRPIWWGWWSWPYWWYHWNGVGRFKWKVHLEPGASTKLEAQWHYFWR